MINRRINLTRPEVMLIRGKTCCENAQKFFEKRKTSPAWHGFKVVATGGFFYRVMNGLKLGDDVVVSTLTNHEVNGACIGALAFGYQRQPHRLNSIRVRPVMFQKRSAGIESVLGYSA